MSVNAKPPSVSISQGHLVSAQGEVVPSEVTSERVPFLAGPPLGQLTLVELYRVFLNASE